MKQIQPLYKSESGVIHHLGLLILGILVLVVIGFAGYKVMENNKDNGSNNDEVTVQVDESQDADDEEDLSPEELDQEVQNAEAEATADDSEEGVNL